MEGWHDSKFTSNELSKARSMGKFEFGFSQIISSEILIWFECFDWVFDKSSFSDCWNFLNCAAETIWINSSVFSISGSKFKLKCLVHSKLSPSSVAMQTKRRASWVTAMGDINLQDHAAIEPGIEKSELLPVVVFLNVRLNNRMPRLGWYSGVAWGGNQAKGWHPL